MPEDMPGRLWEEIRMSFTLTKRNVSVVQVWLQGIASNSVLLSVINCKPNKHAYSCFLQQTFIFTKFLVAFKQNELTFIEN